MLRIAVDIGGTFTDGVAALSPDCRIWVGKTLTTPDDPGVAVSTVIADLLRQVEASGGAGLRLDEVIHGTTLVTNTLIERKGAATGLIVTNGMKDALDIRRELRYDLYDLELELPPPLVAPELRLEAGERLAADGRIVTPLEDAEIRRLMSAVESLDVQSIAISLLHSYANDAHEARIRSALCERFPGMSVSVSSELGREINEYERTSTVVANAYVKPLVSDYLQQLDHRIGQVRPGIPLRVMVSSGGFVSAEVAAAHPIFLLESGPAAGVLSAMNTAKSNQVGHVLAFDMGGTTAKACVAVDDDPPIVHGFECARVHRFKRGSGLPITVPSVDLIEIGAGGGSIAYVNGMGLLNVGPESASSVPGPVCYGLGGRQISVTDADLLLGYLNPDNFLGGEMQLHPGPVRQAMAGMAAELGMAPLDVAWGIYDMVNENMASAARVHIAEKGHDPRTFTMIATGGAGPVHAVEVARKLRIRTVLSPVAAGTGSCLGMLAAPARVDRSWSHAILLSDAPWPEIAERYAELRRSAGAELATAGIAAEAIEWHLVLEMRYQGQGGTVPVALPYSALTQAPGDAARKEFEQQYEKIYGRLVAGAHPQITTWRLVGQAMKDVHRFTWGDQRARPAAANRPPREIFLPLRNTFGRVPVLDRYALPAGSVLEGPLVLEERESTLVVPVPADVRVLDDLTVSITIKEFE